MSNYTYIRPGDAISIRSGDTISVRPGATIIIKGNGGAYEIRCIMEGAR